MSQANGRNGSKAGIGPFASLLKLLLTPIGKGMPDDPLEHMRQRVRQARQLAESITDPQAAKILREMADHGEADIAKLEEERSNRQEPFQIPPITE
jgi:hypothetical protein